MFILITIFLKKLESKDLFPTKIHVFIICFNICFLTDFSFNFFLSLLINIGSIVNLLLMEFIYFCMKSSVTVLFMIMVLSILVLIVHIKCMDFTDNLFRFSNRKLFRLFEGTSVKRLFILDFIY